MQDNIRPLVIVLLAAGLVSQVRCSLLSARTPERSRAVEEVVPVLGRLVEADLIEDEELELRAEVDLVGQADRAHQPFGAPRDGGRFKNLKVTNA